VPVEQRRQSPDHEEGDQEQRDHGQGRGVSGERREVEAHAADHEEDGHEHAEAEGLELCPEPWMGHGGVLVDNP
jgi:hypothetical protein